MATRLIFKPDSDSNNCQFGESAEAKIKVSQSKKFELLDCSKYPLDGLQVRKGAGKRQKMTARFMQYPGIKTGAIVLPRAMEP